MIVGTCLALGLLLPAAGLTAEAPPAVNQVGPPIPVAYQVDVVVVGGEQGGRAAAAPRPRRAQGFSGRPTPTWATT